MLNYGYVPFNTYRAEFILWNLITYLRDISEQPEENACNWKHSP